jgi:hypothetical protein
MRGDIASILLMFLSSLALSLSIIFPNFSLLINANNLSGLLDSVNGFSAQVSGLLVPYDIEYAVSKYTDEDSLYEDTLKSAWEDAAKAKEAVKDLAKFATGIRIETKGNSTSLGIDETFFSRDSEVKGYLSSAVKNAYTVLQQLVDLIDSDKRALDALGADNPNFTRSQVFDEASRFLDTLNAETGNWPHPAQIEADPCTLDGLKYRTICTIRQMKYSQLDVRASVALFNKIIGYPSQSLLEGYFDYHKNLTAVMAQMKNDYMEAVREYDEKTASLSGKFKSLKSQDIGIVTQEMVDTITTQAGELAAEAGRGEPLAEKFNNFNEESAGISREKISMDAGFAQKQDDYLFLSTEGIRDLNFRLNELLDSTDSLAASLSSMQNKAAAAYSHLLLGNEQKKTTAFYISALRLGDDAAEESPGKSIRDYSKAITQLLYVQSSDLKVLNVDLQLDYLAKALVSLGKFGIDVSYETKQLNRLAQITDESLYPSVYLSAEDLLYKLNGKAGAGLEKLHRLRETITAYFADYHSFLEDAAVSQELDRDKIDEYETFFESSLASDELTNLGELYGKYYEIEGYLRLQFNSIASKYLTKFITVSYDYLEQPICNASVRAKVLLSVKNPTSVTFSNITLSQNLTFATDIASPFIFRIPIIGPGEIAYKEFPANVWNNCSNATPALTNRTAIEKRFFDASNRISQLCLFEDCSKLKRVYTDAYEKSDIAAVEDAVSAKVQEFLQNFTGKETKRKLDSAGLLLGQFNKAVDAKVDFEYNASLTYSEEDYLSTNSDYKKLKKMYDVLSPASFASAGSPSQFDEFVSKFSPGDVIDFFDNLDSLGDYLNSSLEKMKNDAKTALLSAKDNYQNSKAGYDSLKKAMDSYNGGSYNKAIILAGLVPEERRAGGSDFIYLLYAGIATALALFCIFLIRKPKEEKKVVRRLLRAT